MTVRKLFPFRVPLVNLVSPPGGGPLPSANVHSITPWLMGVGLALSEAATLVTVSFCDSAVAVRTAFDLTAIIAVGSSPSSSSESDISNPADSRTARRAVRFFTMVHSLSPFQ